MSSFLQFVNVYREFTLGWLVMFMELTHKWGSLLLHLETLQLETQWVHSCIAEWMLASHGHLKNLLKKNIIKEQ